MSESIFSREGLYKLVWSEPLTKLAKKYKTTDWELRKFCTKQNIPLPQSGHWMKLKYGKKVKIEPLPELQSDSDEFDITPPQPISIIKGIIAFTKAQRGTRRRPKYFISRSAQVNKAYSIKRV